MTFQPRMTANLAGISVIEALKCRAWAGAVTDVWHATAAADARGAYVSPHPRLFVVLEHEGGAIDLSLSPPGGQDDRPAARIAGADSLSFIPADIPLWSRTTERMRIRHLDIHFDLETLADRLGEPIAPEQFTTPRLGFADPRMMAIARLIADECGREEARHDLFGDSLILALFIDFLAIPPTTSPRRGTLAAWQMRRATAFLEDNCMRAVRLQELAELTGLSQSYFSLAFKTTTGDTPHQWQMKARMRQVKALLGDPDKAITEIAAVAGFSDQAHFTRTFRRFNGTTPAAWRRSRLE